MDFMIISPAILKNYFPLNTLQEDELNLIMGKTKVENTQKRTVIFNQGSDDEDTIYLISGSVQLESSQGASHLLDAESEQAFFPIANIKPRKFSAKVSSENAAIVKIPTELINSFLSKDDKDKFLSSNFSSDKSKRDVLDSDWMMAMKQTPLFQKLDEEYITQLFQVMEKKHYQSGEQIVRQGELGEYFYLIKEGNCQVSRNDGSGEKILAELEATDSFGEEALLSHTPRNATITMLSDGILMRISKEDFDRFMFQPVVHWIKLTEAVRLCKEGAIQIDVRKDSEHRKSFRDAIKAPIHQLRDIIKELDKDKNYLLICDNSNEGAVASYLFSKFGLDNYILSSENASKVE